MQIYISFILRCPFLIILMSEFILTIKDVKVTIPTAVRKGDNIDLVCSYDMEGDSLYSVKWYKGRREFYRFTPKENPAMKVFPVVGINVERALSNESHLTITSVLPIASGKYSCEISADAPSFHTAIVSGELEVVETPEFKPVIRGLQTKYKIGEVIQANCSSKDSKPAANLTWTVNDIEIIPSFVKILKPEKNSETNLETSTLGLHLVTQAQHYINGRLKLRCIAKIHDIYWQSTEKNIDEDSPRPRVLLASAPTIGHNNVNLAQHSASDQSSLHDKESGSDQNDGFMTHIQSDMSAPRGGSSSFFNNKINFFFLLLYFSFINFYLF